VVGSRARLPPLPPRLLGGERRQHARRRRAGWLVICTNPRVPCDFLFFAAWLQQLF
jgi:hypothetical protein